MRVKKPTKARKPKTPIVVQTSSSSDQPPPAPPPPVVAPEPIPVPVVPHFDIGTPPPPSTRARSRTPAPKARAKSRAVIPWTTGEAPEEAIPRGRTRERSAEEARPKAKARARPPSVAETIAYPENMPILPVVEEDSSPAPVKKTTLKAKKVLADLEKAAAPKKPSKRSESVPSEPPPKPRKPQIRKVTIQSESSDLIVKRGRGRPPGSLGKKKRDLLLEEEFRKVSSVEL